jgi:hypothetical protein
MDVPAGLNDREQDLLIRIANAAVITRDNWLGHDKTHRSLRQFDLFRVSVHLIRVTEVHHVEFSFQ